MLRLQPCSGVVHQELLRGGSPREQKPDIGYCASVRGSNRRHGSQDLAWSLRRLGGVSLGDDGHQVAAWSEVEVIPPVHGGHIGIDWRVVQVDVNQSPEIV